MSAPWSRTARIVILVTAFSLALVFILFTVAGRGKQPANSDGQLLASVAGQSIHALTPINFDPTPERLARGKYLVEGPAHCFLCHSEIDWKSPGAPPLPGKKGGGARWVEPGFPWLVAPNISPDPETGAGRWADAMFARAMREGVGHDGRKLFPIMPYNYFRNMSDEDMASVIAYIRSIAPVRNALPKTEMPDQVKNSLPLTQPVTAPVPGPDMSDPIKRGAYLVTIGNCTACHTPANEEGIPIPGLEFAGGFVLKGPWGEVASANLTPDPSGIPYYDEQLFIQTIRTGQVKARKLNSIMPWGYFRNMTDEDLKAIFAYLRTLKPVKHRVDNTEPPTYCKLCGGKHGFGDRN